MMTDKEIEKDKWGTPQNYGELKVRYKPTGEVKTLKLGIRRMGYQNELIFCESWGYDGGSPTDLNNPDNYEVISITKIGEPKILDQQKIEQITAQIYAGYGSGTGYLFGIEPRHRGAVEAVVKATLQIIQGE